MLSVEEMYKCFIDLLMEDGVVSVKTLVNQSKPFGKINYKPDYQRNYVWDEIKGTTYTESIILGTEIPPKIFWYEDHNELIDGRQRYETIIRFVGNKFCLNEKGLLVLKNLRGKFFRDLDPEIQKLFMGVMIRTLTITMETPSKWDSYKIDQIKKAIFRRYNMGITPLNEVEIARAKYIDNDLNQYFIRRFKEDKKTFELVSSLLVSQKKKDFFDLVEIAMAKIRLLLVIDKIKIDYYVTNKGKSYTKNIFNNINSSQENNKEIYSNFIERIEVLSIIKSHFDRHKFYHYVSLYEVLFWALCVIEKEKISIQRCKSDKFCTALVEFVLKNKSPMLVNETNKISLYMTNKLRYKNIARFFGKYFKIKFDEYIVITQEFKNQVKEFEATNYDKVLTDNISKLHLIRQEAVPYPVHELLNMMKEENILLRPEYQRNENTDKKKASGLIESLMLKFKLPPIFIYVRKDGIREVIDGQQRLLAILGFLGEKYKNEEGIFIESKKHKFKLQGLEVLKDLKGKCYEHEQSDKCIPLKDKNSILNAKIRVVEIYEAKHEDFKPVDLFIRLNSRPYPIKEHSFEMWNTILPNDILKYIKDNTAKHENWFYLLNKYRDTRMKNEELYTVVIFLETRKCPKTHINDIDVKHNNRNEYVSIRMNKWSDVSKFLYETAQNHKFETIKENAENFIEKLKCLLVNGVKYDDMHLNKELNKLIILSKKKKQRARAAFIALWYFLSPIELSVIKNNRAEIKSDIKKMINYLKFNNTQNRAGINVYQNFNKDLEKFRNKYLHIEEKNMALNKEANEMQKQYREILIKEKENTVVNVSINLQGGNVKINN